MRAIKSLVGLMIVGRIRQIIFGIFRLSSIAAESIWSYGTAF